MKAMPENLRFSAVQQKDPHLDPLPEYRERSSATACRITVTHYNPNPCDQRTCQGWHFSPL